MVNHLRNAATAHQAEEQLLTAVTWLLHQAPAAATAAGVAAGVVMLAGVPLNWAVQQVAAGVRITLAQLLTAATSMVEGVEVWVQAQLNVQHNISPPAVAICSGQQWVSAVNFAHATLTCVAGTDQRLLINTASVCDQCSRINAKQHSCPSSPHASNFCTAADCHQHATPVMATHHKLS
jgi:hypothetical protein